MTKERINHILFNILWYTLFVPMYPIILLFLRVRDFARCFSGGHRWRITKSSMTKVDCAISYECWTCGKTKEKTISGEELKQFLADGERKKEVFAKAGPFFKFPPQSKPLEDDPNM